jgi:hypothetical protein
MRSACQSGAMIELADVCIISRTLEAKHGQDKVYGFLGLLRGKTKKAILRDLFRVDDNLPAPVVYLQAAQYSILESQDLRVCHCKAFLSERPVVSSSWVPDWSVDVSLAAKPRTPNAAAAGQHFVASRLPQAPPCCFFRGGVRQYFEVGGASFLFTQATLEAMRCCQFCHSRCPMWMSSSRRFCGYEVFHSIFMDRTNSGALCEDKITKSITSEQHFTKHADQPN